VNNWANFNTATFIQIRSDTDLPVLAANMDNVIAKYMGDQFAGWRKEGNVPDHIKLFEFRLTPLAQWHFKTEIPWHKVSDSKYSYILSAIAILILLIAIINYISLSLTTSAARRKEVGIRKVTGAINKQLIYQFTFESVCLTLVSFLIAAGLSTMALPAFNEFTGKAISVGVGNAWEIISVCLLMVIIAGILAGSYPAFIVSRWRPVNALKNQATASLHAGFTKPLVVMQFALSAFLFISSLVMYRQMKFITTMDLGYDQNHIIVLRTQAGWNRESDRVVEQFRKKALQFPEISSVTGTNASFNLGFSQTAFKVRDENKAAYTYTVDPYYIPTLKLEIIQGRNFDESIASDSNAVIVNEALVREMGWEDPLQEHLNWQQDPNQPGAKVIGVVKDYHNRSLETRIEPLLLSMDTRSRHLVNILVKVDASKLDESLEIVSKIWKELYPDKVYEYSFLDEDVAKQYQGQKRWLGIMNLSATLAGLISCLGLFGLAGVNAVSKTKEIGIRKVLGAKMLTIFILLNRQFFWFAAIAFLIAIPFSWYAMLQWLMTFHYRIEMGFDIFLVSMISGMAVVLIAVSYHAYRAVIANPAKTLKYE
jgi:putative ABC transport system permease protein